MLQLTGFFTLSFAGRRLRAVAAAAAASALTACAPIGAAAGADDASPVVSYQHRPASDVTFVRIERIERGAPDNAHPLVISTDALRQALAGMNVIGAFAMKTTPVFTSEELDQIVPGLVTALAKAGTKEDVTFAASGERGWLGKYSPKTYTTGRLFVRDGRLNLIFGRIGEPYAITDPSVAPQPGSRAQRVDSGWRIAPEGVRLADHRSDWVSVDVQALAPTPPAADSKFQEIDAKLRVLEQLKSSGRITDEEYREHRRAILQGI